MKSDQKSQKPASQRISAGKEKPSSRKRAPLLPTEKIRQKTEHQEPTEDLELTDGPEDLDAEVEQELNTHLALRGPSLDSDTKEHRSETEPSELIEVSEGASSGATSLHDPLRQYLEEVKNYPLLDPQEEFDLAVRLRDSGDIQAAKRLVTANLRLVVKIAIEYRSMYSNLLDLIQEGNIGLMKAVSKFDPTKGARLGYYASWWIRSYILKYLLDNFRLVKIGTTQTQKKLFYHLMREKEKLEAQGLLAGPKLLAEKLHVKEKDVIEMDQRLSGRGAELSLNSPVDPESGADSHLDFVATNETSADDALAQNELLSLLKQRLPEFEKQLNDKERRILSDRLLADEPKTLQEVADLYGLTRERARQIEAKVIEKLREFLKPNL